MENFENIYLVGDQKPYLVLLQTFPNACLYLQRLCFLFDEKETGCEYF